MRYLFILLLIFSFIRPALADCTNPAGAESQTRYDFTAHKLYYCNGTSWVESGGSSGGESGSITFQSFKTPGTATWTKPSSGTVAFIECWGGGGSGARHATSTVAKGGGGGGGYNSLWMPLSALPGSVTITVGVGGAAVSANGDGNVGGNSSFGSYLTAYGGGPGSTGTGGGGGGGGLFSAGGERTPGMPRIAMDVAETFMGSGGTSVTVMSSTTHTPAQPGQYHGGGGGGGQTAATLKGAASIWGGGGGGGRYSSTNGAVGVSQAGGNGGAGGAPGENGQQPGGGGGGSSSTSGKGGDGQCNVTVF